MSGIGNSAPKLIFVVGNSRSGTTMLARALGRHSDIHTFPELHYIEQQVSGTQFRNPVDLGLKRASAEAALLISKYRLGYFARQCPSNFITEARALVERVDFPRSHQKVFRSTLEYLTAETGKKVSCEQTPRNVFYIEELLEAYTDARIIHMIRDPRDVLLSQKYKWRRREFGAPIPRREAIRSRLNYHPYIMARLWKTAVQVGLKWEANPNVLTLRFEDVLPNLEETLRSVCQWLGVKFESDMLNIAKLGSSAHEDKPENVGPDVGRIAAWTQDGLSASELAICERVNQAEMMRLGYKESNEKAPMYSRLVYLSLPLKMIGASIFNVRRVNSIISWAKKRFFSLKPTVQMLRMGQVSLRTTAMATLLIKLIGAAITYMFTMVIALTMGLYQFRPYT